MSVSQLSTSSQNYLKAIWGLQEWSDTAITPSMVAEKVGVKLSTASDAVRKLTEQGLLEHTPYGSISLTGEGRQHAVAMVRRHRLIETFLVQKLGYRWDEVHDEAETLEHAVSDLLVDRIDEHLGFPAADPHGDPIPARDGAVDRPDAVLLSTLEPGTRACVVRISDEDPGLLQYFAGRGFGVGRIVRVEAPTPYSDSIGVTFDEAPGDGLATEQNAGMLVLGRAATDSVWVTRQD